MFKAALEKAKERVFGASSPSEAPPAREPFGVRLMDGALDAASLMFTLRYETSGGVSIWGPAGDSNVVISLLRADSGTGKSTLLVQLHDRLTGDRRSTLTFDFTPDLAAEHVTAVAYVPQNPPMVKHWVVGSLLPVQSRFTSCFFSSGEAENLSSKRLAELSGGARRRVFAASSLERLLCEGGSAAFLMLDETLDGTGAHGVAGALSEVSKTWAECSQVPLHVLLVSHLTPSQIRKNGSPPFGELTLSVVERGESDLRVRAEYEHEPLEAADVPKP